MPGTGPTSPFGALWFGALCRPAAVVVSLRGPYRCRGPSSSVEPRATCRKRCFPGLSRGTAIDCLPRQSAGNGRAFVVRRGLCAIEGLKLSLGDGQHRALGLGWVSARAEGGSHGLCVPNSPARLGPDLRLSGRTSHSRPDCCPYTLSWQWWGGDAAVPVCISRMPGGLWGGFRAQGGGGGGHGLFRQRSDVEAPGPD